MLQKLKALSKVVGMKQVLRAVGADQVQQVLLAQDADEYIKNKVVSTCEEHGITPVPVPSMEELGKACGIAVKCATVAILK